MNTSTIDYYVIQSAVLSPQLVSSSPLTGSGGKAVKGLSTGQQPHYQYSLLQPFHDITHLPHDLSSSCLIDIRDHPNSLLFFRIQSVSVTGLAGPYSMSISIKTPATFHPIFEYSGRPFDRHGLLYWLGTAGGTRPYENPHHLKEVTLSASTLQGAIHLLASHTSTVEGGTSSASGGGGQTLCMTHNKMQSWFSVDIASTSGGQRYLQLHAYCLRSGKGESYKLRNWELHGKVHKQDKKWHILKRHKSCLDLKESSYSTAGWIINTMSHLTSSAAPPSLSTSPSSMMLTGQGEEGSSPNMRSQRGKGTKVAASASLVMDSMELPTHSSSPDGSGSLQLQENPVQPLAYRYFRIIQTGLNSSGDHHLVCNGIELYGILFDQPL
jgi:hypothetical protein